MSQKMKLTLSIAAVAALIATASSMFLKRANHSAGPALTADSTAGLVTPMASTPVPSLDSLDARLTRESVTIERWAPQYVDGVLILRGRVADQATSARIGEAARQEGFGRVANLLTLIKLPDDKAIERDAERRLAESRALEGCRFALDAKNGILTVNGEVERELQKDAARQILRGVEGVREVRIQFASL